MAVSKNILGMNARNFLYIRKYNFASAKRRADDKLATKQVLIKHHIPSPKLIATFESREKIRHFPWHKLPKDGFVIKPARGFAGAGILVVSKWYGDHGKSPSGKLLTIKQIETMLLDILDGAHSLQNLPDIAFAEEIILPHPILRKLNPNGLPDIRIIVLNHIPIMAMMRLPTSESSGKANLAQGALGIGIDMRTGITNSAYYKYSKAPTYIPGTKIKVRGIKLPDWDNILLTAARAQSVSGLGYAGIDIVLDANSGPMVLEINARPGLGIQSVNLRSLRTRLERIENMSHVTPQRGVEVAKSLYAEAFSEKVDIGPKIVNIVETVRIANKDEEFTAKALINTATEQTRIDAKLVEQLHLSDKDLDKKTKSIKITFYLKDRKIRSNAKIVKRMNSKYPLEIGQADLSNFLIKPTTDNSPDQSKN